MGKTMNETDMEIAKVLLEVYPARIDRPELVNKTGIPRTSVYDSLMRMDREGFVEISHEVRESRGRPKSFWRLDLEAL